MESEFGTIQRQKIIASPSGSVHCVFVGSQGFNNMDGKVGDSPTNLDLHEPLDSGSRGAVKSVCRGRTRVRRLGRWIWVRGVGEGVSGAGGGQMNRGDLEFQARPAPPAHGAGGGGRFLRVGAGGGGGGGRGRRGGG